MYAVPSTRRRLLQRHVGVLLSLSVLLGMVTVVATAPQARAGDGAVSTTTPGTTGSSTIDNGSNAPGGVATINCLSQMNGAGKMDSRNAYLYISNCDPKGGPNGDGPCTEYCRKFEIAPCIMGVHVWRFYGKDSPGNYALSTTLSEVHLRDWCLGASDSSETVNYLPNPADMGTVPPADPPRVWNIQNTADSNIAQQIYNENFFTQSLNGAQSCWKSDTADADVDLTSGCALTTGKPLVRTGKINPATSRPYSCRDLQAPPARRLSSWLTGAYPYGATSPDQTVYTEYANKVIATQYNDLRNMNSNKVLAATLSDIPTDRTQPNRGAVLSEAAKLPATINTNDPASLVTASVTDTLPCSSPVDFVYLGADWAGATQAEKDNQRELGICIAPVAGVGFSSNYNNPRVSMYVPNLDGQGRIRTRYYREPMNIDVTDNTFSVRMQYMRKVSAGTPTQRMQDIFAAYKAQVRNSLEALERTSMENPNPAFGSISGKYGRPGGWYFNTHVSGVNWTNMMAPDSYNDVDAAMKTLFEGDGGASDTVAGSYGPVIRCYTSRLTDQVGITPPGVPGMLPTATPTPTTTFTTTASPTAPPTTAPPTTAPPTYPPAGTTPARVVVSMPNNYYTAGRYKDFTAHVDAVQAMCPDGAGGYTRVCSHVQAEYRNGGNNDETVETDHGFLTMNRVGPDNADYIACQRNEADTAKCGYMVWRGNNADSTSSRMTGQTITTRHFSASPQNTLLNLGLDNAGVYIVHYKSYDPPDIWVDPAPYTATNGYANPDGSGCPSGTTRNIITWACEYTVDPPGYWIITYPYPVVDYKEWVTPSITAAVGTDWPLTRRVYGSVGVGGR